MLTLIILVSFSIFLLTYCLIFLFSYVLQSLGGFEQELRACDACPLETVSDTLPPHPHIHSGGEASKWLHPSHPCPTFSSTQPPSSSSNHFCVHGHKYSLCRALVLWLNSLPLFGFWPAEDWRHCRTVGRRGAEGAAGHALHHCLLPHRGASFHSRAGDYTEISLCRSNSPLAVTALQPVNTEPKLNVCPTEV